MAKPQVGVVGYGVIGQRLADGVALQEDMDLVGVVDVAPTTVGVALGTETAVADIRMSSSGNVNAVDVDTSW